MTLHTILGANGPLALALSRQLFSAGLQIRQVSRHPTKVNATDSCVTADLMDAEATARAVEGSEVVYLVVGLQYNLQAWKEQWPRVMANVIDACIRHQARLVFFDNVYAYGLVEGPMTEYTPFNPCSRKGEVRAAVANTLLSAMHAGQISAQIVRSADFYGIDLALPRNSFFDTAVIDRLRQAKTPQWLGDSRHMHSFSYLPDIARSLAMLATSPTAWGHTWHALTCAESLTGNELVALACRAAGRPFKMQAAPWWILKLMAMYQPVIRENQEMMYQFERPYEFSSAKMNAAFDAVATPYCAGLKAIFSIRQGGALATDA